MSLSYGIAHAGWMPERKPFLRRLTSQLPELRTFVSVSQEREHASIWATRLWEWAAEQDGPVVLLNDDVSVPPSFVRHVEAVTTEAHGQVIALHTTAPVARSIANAGGHWLRSYWLTGPGYILPKGAAADLLEWCKRYPNLAWAYNEDGAIMHWAWHRQRPIWHVVPALVTHSTAVASTLGYDHHSLREATVTWESENLPELEHWRPSGEPPLVECPWMPREQLAANLRAASELGPRICSMCLRRPGVVHGESGGCICRDCLGKSINAVLGVLQ